ncbi:MAG: hypothetical protein WC495_03880 [Patescibacteria group bacterium]|jgi:hypothetical protein
MNLPFVKKNELYNFVDKNFIYLAIGLVIIVIFFFTYFLIVPTWKDIRDVSVLELQQKQTRLTEMQKFLSELKTMRDTYAEIDYNDIQRLETVLPKGFDRQQLFLQIQQFAEQSGFPATSITFNEKLAATSSTSRRNSQNAQSGGSVVSTGGDIEEVTINITVQGITTYDSFKQFLTSIESFGPMLTLSTIDYPVSSSAFSFSLTTYYLSES